jgi:hypothetical protein
MIDMMSGNAVPPGAMPEEVRDNVPIDASEGEYILSADVVRYIGLDKIQKMEKQAKEGIASMHEEGRIGGEEPMPAPEVPMGGPMDGPMGYNQGGLVTPDFNQREIPFAFNPMPYVSGEAQGQLIKKFIGPNGRVLYIPINKAGNPVVPIPKGFRDANEAPTTPAQAIAEDRQSEKSPMWGDKLTPEQIRQQQESWRKGGPTLNFEPEQNTGQLPGFMGDLVGGIRDRLQSAFSRLTSGEALGGLIQAAATLKGGPMAGIIVGGLVDRYNESRKREGLPEVPAERIMQEVAGQAGLSSAEVQEIVNNTQTSPSSTRMSTAAPETPADVASAATEEGALDLSQYNVIGRSGTADNPSAMVMTPEGQVLTLKEGDTIPGTNIVVKNIDLDHNTPLENSVKFEGSLQSLTPSSPASRQQERPTAGMGSANIGFGSLMQRRPASPQESGSKDSAPPPSPFRDSAGGSDRSSAEEAVRSGRTVTAPGTTSGGVSVSSPEAQAGFAMGESLSRTRDSGVGGAFQSSFGSTPARTSNPADYSTGTRVSDFSNYDRDNPRGFNRGGLVDSPYKNYDIAKGYKKGGLVKRNSK